LSYLELEMPIIAATDKNTDLGDVLVENKCGYWVESGDSIGMDKAIDSMISDPENFNEMKKNSWNLLQNKYTVSRTYNLILNKLISV